MLKKIAILDLYNGIPNQGMRCIKELVQAHPRGFEYEVFDVRQKGEMPRPEDFDIYISSGGPGNPLEGDGVWDKKYFNLIDALWQHNRATPANTNKKHVFFICHSFQMVCAHFGLGEVTRRKSTSFGIFPVHKTLRGQLDPIFEPLPDPFYAVDHRDYQLVQPDLKVFKKFGATILALEKIRTEVEYERAIMAVRLSPEFLGVQFHPEADAAGMAAHFENPENSKKVIATHGEKKYKSMLRDLHDPKKIAFTHQTLLPTFVEAVEIGNSGLGNSGLGN
jgi:homoserine O-succinyltransferase/O-acetyltransferase